MIKKYVGLLLRSSGMDSDAFWNTKFSGDEEITDGFYAFNNPQSADALAHKMHTENPQLRQQAIDVISEISEDSEYQYCDHLFTKKEDADILCNKVNNELHGNIAKAYVIETWIYNHVDLMLGFVNPYAVIVNYWNTDLTEKTVEYIVKNCDR